MTTKTFSARRLLGASAVGAAALASAFALTVASPAAASRHAVAASAPSCSSSTLVVWLNTQGNGAAGSSYFNLEFTNLGAHACTLLGYPGVSGVDLGGRRLGSAASRDAVHRPVTVTVRSGATVHAILRIVDAGNYPSSTCAQTTAAGLRVYPPGQTASKLVPYPFAACSRSGPTYLQVEAVQPGFSATS